MLEFAFFLACAKAIAFSPVGRPTVFVQISMLLKSDWCNICTNSIRSLGDSCTGANTLVDTRRGWVSRRMAVCESRRYRIGGAKRDRTADPLRARQVLSQLSYSPRFTGLF